MNMNMPKSSPVIKCSLLPPLQKGSKCLCLVWYPQNRTGLYCILLLQGIPTEAPTLGHNTAHHTPWSCYILASGHKNSHTLPLNVPFASSLEQAFIRVPREELPINAT